MFVKENPDRKQRLRNQQHIPFKIPTESVNITPDKHAPLKKYLRTNQSTFMN